MPDSLPMPVTALSRAQRTAILNLVRRAARAEILPRFRRIEADGIFTKTGPQDVVTEADLAAEAMIARGLARLFPGALVVGEEAAAKDDTLAARIAGAETAFTVDPVDGTWNYANGLAVFGVMLSMTRFGRPVFGLLYDPLMDDAVLADLDGPAEMLRPRQAARALSVSAGGALPDLSGFVPLHLLPKERQAQMAATLPRFARAWSLRCSCHEYRLFAQGSADFVLSARLTPWDHAPGVLVAERAGGHAAMLDGSAYNAATTRGYLLVAANRPTWDRLRDAFAVLLDPEGAAPEPAAAE